MVAENATFLTAVIGSATAIVTAIAWPYWQGRAKKRDDYSTFRLMDSQEVAKMMKDRGDEIQARLDTTVKEHEKQIAQLKKENEIKIAEVETKWTKIHAQDQAQIAQMQLEIDNLYRRLVMIQRDIDTPNK